MKILVSNDDGIFALGLEILESACAKVGDVSVVAPDREQSAASHALTVSRPLRAVKRGPDRYQVDGTPTDSVLMALDVILDQKPDLVVSGINHGANMGEDVLYSGTVAAAMEGLSAGIPAAAFSHVGGNRDLMKTQTKWVEQIVEDLVGVPEFPPETLLNINFPPIPGDEIKGVKVTRLGRRVYSESLKKMKDPWGHDIYWIGGGKSSWTGADDSDFRAIRDGYISITPLHVDLTQYDHMDIVRGWQLGR